MTAMVFPPDQNSGKYIQEIVEHRKSQSQQLKQKVAAVKDPLLKNLGSWTIAWTESHLNEEDLKTRVGLIKDVQKEKKGAVDTLQKIIILEQTFLMNCLLPEPSEEQQKLLVSLHERGLIDLTPWDAQKKHMTELQKSAQENISEANKLLRELEEKYKAAKEALEPAARNYEKGSYLDHFRNFAIKTGANLSPTPCLDRLRDKWFPDPQTSEQKEEE